MAEPDIRAEELRKTRNYVRRRLSPLRTQIDRILEHVQHMDSGDLDRLHALLEQEPPPAPAGMRESLESFRRALHEIHDADQCQRDHEREGMGDDQEDAEAAPWWRPWKDAFTGKG